MIAWDACAFAYHVDILDDVRITRISFIKCFGIEQIELGQTIDDGNTFPTLSIAAGMVYGTVLKFAQHIPGFHVVTIGKVVSATCREIYDVVGITVHPFLEPASSLIYDTCVETRFTVGIHVGDILVCLFVFIVGVVAMVFHSAESGFVITAVGVIDGEAVAHEGHVYGILRRADGTIA